VTGAPPDGRVAAVVVDHDAGPLMAECVASVVAQCATTVVVENGDGAAGASVLADAGLAVPLVAVGRNVGYGAGVNRGVAATEDSEYVLICNADLRLHDGAVAALAEDLRAEPSWAIVGPLVLNPDGEPYPSARRFPSPGDAAGHAVLGAWWPDNPFSRRYRPTVPREGPATTSDWVSGACMLARRSALEELGGFDEAYFMYAEDMDLCWRARQAGWGVAFEPGASVTHAQGVSTRRHPYAMIVAHHRSALRFARRSTRGWRRVLLPVAAVLLGARLAVALVGQTRRH
jgi:N-acetylglucosaminyl-diphospho-decaprenol L-rhamnosyltransferase